MTTQTHVDQRIDMFWEFMIERELIRQRRLTGLPREQWTEDEIFRTYSFTNVKREHDRTTMLLWREFYGDWNHSRLEDESPEIQKMGTHPDRIALLNAAIFRLTGTIEAARAMGWSTEWDRQRFCRTIGARIADGLKTFTGAYIIPNLGRSDEKFDVVADIIQGIWDRSGIGTVINPILDTDRWEVACDRLTECYGIGQFLAKEILLDYILATGWRPVDWETWTPVGPGARRGAGWILTGRVEEISEAKALEMCRQIYAMRDEKWGQEPRVLIESNDEMEAYLPSLDLTDIQFQLCEVAKYQKAKTGTGKPKKFFRPTIDDVTKK